MCMSSMGFSGTSKKENCTREVMVKETLEKKICLSFAYLHYLFLLKCGYFIIILYAI